MLVQLIQALLQSFYIEAFSIDALLALLAQIGLEIVIDIRERAA